MNEVAEPVTHATADKANKRNLKNNEFIEEQSLPLVSVIITNFNYGKYLVQCIQSVKDQSYPSIECIVVDDCSTDNSREILEKLDYKCVQVIYNKKIADRACPL